MGSFYHGDCLFVMKHDIAPESVDLIYLDPPFFTGKIQKGTKKWQPGAMEVSYEDSKKFWGESEKVEAVRKRAPEWMKHIALERPDFASYLWYMMIRLESCKRVLKPIGSIYLHCDWRASHYLKMAMDEIFDEDNFRNEIIWYYNSGARKKSDFGKRHDVTLRYSKTDSYFFDDGATSVREPYSPDINIPRSKVHYYDPRGKVADDVWRIPIIPQNDKAERTGYPTQKPEKLLKRIIEASSNEGDLVLDPFCGCGTTVIVASKLNRHWIGIDIDTSPREPHKLPTAFQVISNRSHSLFEQARYVTRDLSEVKEMDGRAFEAWVNEFHRATKPQPDRGVDGITNNGIPIQAKTFQIKYNVLSQFVTDTNHHPLVPKPIKEVIIVSQTGFDDSARKRQFDIETSEGIQVRLETPDTMLRLGET